MDMQINVVLMIVTILYFYVAALLFLDNKLGLGLAYMFYGFANFGLLLAAKNI